MFILVRTPFGFATGELDLIQWWPVKFSTSWLRILLCSPDRFLTQCIKEFQYSWPYSNLHNICGMCGWLDGGIGSIV